MLRRKLTIARSMASAAADVRVSVRCLLLVALLLVACSRAGRGAQPEPALPAAAKPAIEGPVAAPAPATPAVEGKKADAQPSNEQFEANLLRAAAAKKAAAANKTNALAQQWRPTLMVELSFIRLVCPNLSPEQRVVVKAAGEQALFSAADAAATPRAVNELPVLSGLSPQARIRTALSDALRDTLAADQWERFAAESQARAERRKTAVIRLVVEHLDEALYLTPQQRDQISQSLADHWQSAWENWLQLRYARNLPVMPEDIVTPYLDADQKQAWEKIPKVQLASHVMNVNMGNVAPDTGWWDEGLSKDKDPAAGVPPP